MFLIAASIAVATSSIAGTINQVSAAQCSAVPCDGWGQSTKKAANEDGKQVGEHSSNPDPNNDDPHDTPRDGLGNFAGDNTDYKNPSDLGDFVNGELP